MATTNEYGNEQICDRCGEKMLLSDESCEIAIDIIGNHGGEEMSFIKTHVFSKKNGFFGAKPDEVHGDYCKDCAKTLYPWFCRILDILILRRFVNKLEKKINEQKRSNRTQNNRAPSNAACKCCKISRTRINGYSACRSITQAGQKYYREPLQ